jgi:ribosome assembly protein RRB1
MLCLSSDDNQITMWDLSVEADDDEALFNAKKEGLSNDLPPQLLFIHQGQTEVKEIHFHPQIPGVVMSTGQEGIDLFKPAINVAS